MAAKSRPHMQGYKRQVVDLVTSIGRMASSVAAEVGLHHTLLSRCVWRRGQRNGAAGRPASASSLKPLPTPMTDLAAETARPRCENERLRMGCDILRKGIAIFGLRQGYVLMPGPA